MSDKEDDRGGKERKRGREGRERGEREREREGEREMRIIVFHILISDIRYLYSDSLSLECVGGRPLLLCSESSM